MRTAVIGMCWFGMFWWGMWCCRTALAASPAVIEVHGDRTTGEASPLLFGHFIEHEHNTIQGGLWAELLHDRKFEQGDLDRDGVSNGWVPEERITNHYWDVVNGRTPHARYFVDHKDFYGGGSAQAIELPGAGGNQASIYQINIPLVKGRRYHFYVYLKRRGAVSAWIDFDRLGGTLYAHQEIRDMSERWEKTSGEFSAPEDTRQGRMRIGVKGSGVVWIDSASLMPSDNLGGMRRDVVEVLRLLRIPIMRYPGGCFADEYHWRNGVGPRDRRPETWSDIWKEWDPNDFGTDEYMMLARELGFEPHMTANYASGTVDEAAAWLEYMNGPADSEMGKLRMQNGSTRPYGARYWGIGNEGAQLCVESYTGTTDLNEYARRFEQFRNALQRIDPSVRLMAGGTPPGPPEWNHLLLEKIAVPMMTASIYTGDGPSRSHTRLDDLERYYRSVVAEPQEFQKILERVLSSFRIGGRGKPPLLALTEFNSWWLAERVDPDYRLCNALYFGGVFHALLRRANEIAMAEVSTTINVQGLVSVNAAGTKLTPPYFAYVMYRNHTGPEVLETTTIGPATEFQAQLPALDAIATRSRDKTKLYLSVVNRSELRSVPAEVQIRGWAAANAPVKVYELTGPDGLASNPYGGPIRVHITESTLEAGALGSPYSFPAHSITILEMAGQR